MRGLVERGEDALAGKLPVAPGELSELVVDRTTQIEFVGDQ